MLYEDLAFASDAFRSRGREIDFEAEVKKRQAKAKEAQPFVFAAQEEDDEQVTMSEEPPTRNPR